MAVSQTEIGYIGLRTVSGRIIEDQRADFTWPKSLQTYEKMSQDPTIAAANNILDVMIGKIGWQFEPPQNPTDDEKRATEFLNFCKDNMENTWKSTIEEIGSYRIYGYHVCEKVFKQVQEGEWEGKFKWKYLPTRSQTTIDEWVFDKNNRNLKAIKQNLNNLTNIYGLKLDNFGYVRIPRKRFMLFTYGKRRGNPEGKSPLKDCYQPWKYKKIIEDYEAVGVAKDLGGVPVLQAPADWLTEAQDDPTSTKAQTLETLKEYMANLHSGESTYMILPNAYDDRGNELFKFQLIGVDGGGKQYNTRDIINGKQTEILMIYLADVLKLGNESHGSFALAESKNNLLAHGVQHHLDLISDVFNYDLVPQTLRVNGWNFPTNRMPRLVYKNLDEHDLDSLSKFIQRLGSVNLFPRTKETMNSVLEWSGFDYRLTDKDVDSDRNYDAKTLNEDIFTNNDTRASEGMKEGNPSGTGSANSNNSATNSDNSE